MKRDGKGTCVNEGGRPVAFNFSNATSKRVAVSCRRKGRNSNYRRHEKTEIEIFYVGFELVTEQRSVAFMLDNRRRTKFKNREWNLHPKLYHSLPTR